MSFPITCTACHKTFTISDEIYEKKVAGRVVTIKCKSCAQGIRVDGTKGGAVPAPAPAAPTAAAAEPEPPPAPAGEPLWAVDYPDGPDREFTTAEVIAELERGAVDGATLVWRDGMAEWLEVHQVPELAGELTKIEAKKKAAAMAAALAAAKNAGPVHKPRAPMPTVTGLAGLPGAAGNTKPKQPSSPELFKARAQPPSAPAVATPLPKPRAQAPSDSDDATPVPFPKARAQQPSTPELAKPRVQQPSAPVLPLPKPAAPPPPVMQPPAPPPALTPPLPQPFAAPPVPPVALPVPAPTFDATPPLPASVAKVVSRPPQLQPTFPLSASPINPLSSGPVLVADHASVEWPEAKSKKPLIIVAVLVLAAIVVGAIVLLGGKDEAPPSAPISALPGSPAAAPTPSPTSTPTPSQGAAQTGADTATGSDPIATSPDRGATPGAGFAELFAAGARKAESKGAKMAPTTRFDAAATKAPLAQAASDAQACKQSGGPTGKVTVVVTFDPSGKVSSATVTEPPFAGTATATCISSALKRATIAPFGGLPGTVSKTFSIL